MPINLIKPIPIPLPKEPSKSRTYSILFRDSLSPDIQHINDLIMAYNQFTNDAEKITALTELEQTIDQMDRKYPDDLKRHFPDYHETIHKNLFNAIKHERSKLGVLPHEDLLSFPEYLATMDPDKVERMLVILLEPNFTQEKLAQGVFNEGEPGRDAFIKMLSRYEIGVLGGNNSKNFTVLDTQTSKTMVLKAENRMSVPKDAVQYLRQRSMKEIFTADVSEREAICLHPVKKERVTRTLLFTEFHPGGDLKNHGKKTTSPEKKVDSALYLYLQMAQILDQAEQDGCCFTDMKNANWLVNEWGELRIADKKAFLYTHDMEVTVTDPWGDETTQTIRVLDPADKKNKFYYPPRSKHMESPELATFTEKQNAIDVGKMHAYMLGKNLYQYLTGCSDSAFFTFNEAGEITGALHDVHRFDFSNPVFQTDKGKQLERTIKQLIYTDAADAQLTLQKAMEELALIEYPELVGSSVDNRLMIDTYQLLKGLEAFKLTDEDEIIMTFISERREALQSANTEEDVRRINEEVRAMLYLFRENHEQFAAIKDMVRVFKEDPTPAIAQKGAQIEAAFLRVPLVDRASIADGKTKPQKAVLKEMGRETNLFKRLTQAFHQTTTTPSEDMQKFLNFKSKFAKEFPKPNDSDLENQENIRPN